MISSPLDPRGLIADAYKMEGISPPECRSIFLDWALEPREAGELRAAAQALAKQFSHLPNHPMSVILKEAAIELTTAPKRRGGRQRK